ncbi:MAG TPA: creatininase family protein [Bacteroidota bacterium]
MKDASFDVALLPWGATEAHNYHLPYGTDILESDSFAAASGERAASLGARIVVLPSIPFGVNTGQLDIPLTINMNPSTQMAIVKDIIVSLEGYGIPKLVIFNSHGGNDFRQMIRELQPSTKIFLCTLNWYRALDHTDYFDRPGDHADEMETSLLLHIAPEFVLPLERAGDGKEYRMQIQGFREGWAWTPRQWTKATHDTGVGDPRGATAAKGERFFNAIVDKVGAFIADLASTGLDDLYEKP